MIEIKKIPLSRLYKMEVALLMTNVVNTLEKHNPETLRLGDMYDLLLVQMEKAEILKKFYGVHPLTSELDKLHAKRLKYAALINMQLKSLEKVDCEETQRMVKHAQRVSKKFLTYLGQKCMIVIHSQIDIFFSQLQVEENTPAKESFEKLGLQTYLDDLEKANKLHLKLFNQRKRDIKERPNTSDRLLEKETQNMMRLFFEQVNSYQKTFKDIDYSPLISELNVTLTAYSKVLKTRVATNKRRARKKALAAKKAAKEIELKSPIKAKAEVKAEVLPINGNSVLVNTNSNSTAMNKKKEEGE